MTSTIDMHDKPVVGPCPSWCTLEQGHDWDTSEADGCASRGHGGETSEVEGLGRRDSATVSFGGAEYVHQGLGQISVYMNAQGNFTAEQARAYARYVLETADELNQATA